MSFPELASLVESKMEKMIKDLKDRVSWLKKTERGQEEIMNIISKTLSHI